MEEAVAGAVEVAAIAQRASDKERDAVVYRLRAATAEGRLTLDEFAERVALVLETKTVDQLVPLTADLPDPALSAESGPARTGASMTQHRRLVSVFGRARHTGSWDADPITTVVAVFGQSYLDLTGCRLAPGVDVLELRTFNVFAGVEIVVPPGAVVDVRGVAVFGGRHLEHDAPAVHGAPVLGVRVRSYSVFGGLLVRNARRVP